jgi:hypothetical protein
MPVVLVVRTSGGVVVTIYELPVSKRNGVAGVRDVNVAFSL